MSGRFITFEGIDGAGKSTHIDALAQRLRERGATVACTREPGGTPLAEQLRELLLHTTMDALTEALVVFAARRDHVQQVIAPAVARGETVLCDRFSDASFAYQGGGRGVAADRLGMLEQWVHGELQPDLTLWLDLPAEIGAQRRAAVRAADRFEQQDLEFFARVRAAYAARCESSRGRIVRIDAALARDAVWRQIEAAVQARGW
jgi:dTMP kinase